MNKRALITGVNGFVGAYLREALLAAGWDVVGLGIEPAEDDLRCDMADGRQVDDALAQAGPITHVFHLAAQTFVPAANDAPLEAMAVNYGGTVNLVQSLRAHRPDARLLYVSSADAYGPPRYLPMDEDHPMNPPNSYAISKAAADHYCAYAHKAYGMSIVRLRPFNHSGPGQSDRFVLSSFARQIARIEAGKQDPTLRVGNLEAARDFLHVRDVARAYVLCAEHAPNGAVFNICSGRSVRIQQALDSLLAQAAVPIAVTPDPERMRPVDVPEVRGDATALYAATGWTPTHPFDDLLHDLLADWRRRIKEG